MKLIVIALIAVMIALPFASAQVVSRPRWSACKEGATRCTGLNVGAYLMRCTRGAWRLALYCSPNQFCDEKKGCVPKRSTSVLLRGTPYAPTLERPYWQ